MSAADRDAHVLRGAINCAKCRKTIPSNAARAILYLGPQQFVVACLGCSQNEAGLNHELAKVPLVVAPKSW